MGVDSSGNKDEGAGDQGIICLDMLATKQMF